MTKDNGYCIFAEITDKCRLVPYFFVMSKRSKPSRLFTTQFVTSCISTALVLILLGSIVLFVLSARQLSREMKENINVSMLLDDSLDEQQIKGFKTDIESRHYVKQVDYISKEEALEEECKAMGTNPEEFLDYNPFTASFEVKLVSDFANTDSLKAFSEELVKTGKVVEVIYPTEFLDSVNKNIRKISIVLLIIAGLFTYISFTLIKNTVQLSIFSKRFTINTMKLVGASWWFIRKPFLKRALLLGVVAAIIADGVIFAGVYLLKRQEPEVSTIVTMQTLLIVGGAVLAFGLIISSLCTYFSLNKYLKMSSNELYHV